MARDIRLLGQVPLIQRSQGKQERGAQRATKRATKWWQLLVCSWLDTSTKEIVPSRTVFGQNQNTSAVAWYWVWPVLFCFFSSPVAGVLPSGHAADPNKLWLLYNFLATLIDVYYKHFISVFLVFILHSRNIVENVYFINRSLELLLLWLICTAIFFAYICHFICIFYLHSRNSWMCMCTTVHLHYSHCDLVALPFLTPFFTYVCDLLLQLVVH